MKKRKVILFPGLIAEVLERDYRVGKMNLSFLSDPTPATVELMLVELGDGFYVSNGKMIDVHSFS